MTHVAPQCCCCDCRCFFIARHGSTSAGKPGLLLLRLCALPHPRPAPRVIVVRALLAARTAHHREVRRSTRGLLRPGLGASAYAEQGTTLNCAAGSAMSHSRRMLPKWLFLPSSSDRSRLRQKREHHIFFSTTGAMWPGENGRSERALRVPYYRSLRPHVLPEIRHMRISYKQIS